MVPRLWNSRLLAIIRFIQSNLDQAIQNYLNYQNDPIERER